MITLSLLWKGVLALLVMPVVVDAFLADPSCPNTINNIVADAATMISNVLRNQQNTDLRYTRLMWEFFSGATRSGTGVGTQIYADVINRYNTLLTKTFNAAGPGSFSANDAPNLLPNVAMICSDSAFEQKRYGTTDVKKMMPYPENPYYKCTNPSCDTLVDSQSGLAYWNRSTGKKIKWIVNFPGPKSPAVIPKGEGDPRCSANPGAEMITMASANLIQICLNNQPSYVTSADANGANFANEPFLRRLTTQSMVLLHETLHLNPIGLIDQEVNNPIKEKYVTAYGVSNVVFLSLNDIMRNNGVVRSVQNPDTYAYLALAWTLYQTQQIDFSIPQALGQALPVGTTITPTKVSVRNVPKDWPENIRQILNAFITYGDPNSLPSFTSTGILGDAIEDSFPTS